MTCLDEGKLREIAAVAWAANAELQALHADPSPSLPGDREDEEAHAVTVAGIRAILDGATAEQVHETWMRARQAQGWTRGPVKDSRLRTHPALVPYADLPEHQKVKDRVLAAIVRAMAGQDAPELAAAMADRDDYAARLKATSESWTQVAAERDKLRELLDEATRIAFACRNGALTREQRSKVGSIRKRAGLPS